MNREEVKRILCDWKWSDESVDSVVDEIEPLFSETTLKVIHKQPTLDDFYQGFVVYSISDLVEGDYYIAIKRHGNGTIHTYLLQYTGDCDGYSGAKCCDVIDKAQQSAPWYNHVYIRRNFWEEGISLFSVIVIR